jgi:Ca2+/H+ antiporter
MEITIGVAVGSSIQIAAGMIPLLVLIAWPMGQDLTLFFVSLWPPDTSIDAPHLFSFPRNCHADS